MAENYKAPGLSRRELIKSTALGLAGLILGDPALASEDQWKKIKDAIPAGKYDVLLYTFPGGGKDQKFLYVLDVENGLKPEIYTIGVEKLGSKSLDDVLSHIEKTNHYLQPYDVKVAPIKKGSEVFGYAVYNNANEPYNLSVGKQKYSLIPKPESTGGGGNDNSGGTGGGGQGGSGG